MKLQFSKLSRQRPTISAILWALCIGVLILEVFTLHKSFQVLYRARFQETGALPSKSVRINFENYNQAVDRISKGEEYESNAGGLDNPFVGQDAVR